MRKMRPDLEDVLSTLLRIFLIDISSTPHALALIRSANAAARLLLRSQAERKAATLRVRQDERRATAAQSAEMQGSTCGQTERKEASFSSECKEVSSIIEVY